MQAEPSHSFHIKDKTIFVGTMLEGKTIGAVIPAHNEAQAIGKVVLGLQRLSIHKQSLIDRIVVCNNASTDHTKACAQQAGAEVVDEARPGYGYACLAGIAHLNDTDIILFVDGDHSVDYAGIPLLLSSILNGADLCIGSRTLANSEPGALAPQQLLGNRLATWMINSLWQTKVTDLGPLRAIRRSTIELLDMQSKTFGWTVEMQVKAIIQGMNIQEVPAVCRRRIGQSKISGTWKGTLLAGYGIISTIIRLYRLSRRQVKVAGQADA